MRGCFKGLGAEIAAERSDKGIEDDLHKIIGVCDAAFKDNANDPTCLPNFEGDYWSGEVEHIIVTVKKQEEEKQKSREASAAFTAGCAKIPVVQGLKKGTRSNPGLLEVEALKVMQTRDPVMARLGASILKMKQNFMVAHLYTREFVEAIEDNLPFTADDETAAIMGNSQIREQLKAACNDTRSKPNADLLVQRPFVVDAAALFGKQNFACEMADH